MNPTPTGWSRLSSAMFYDDAPKAIDWLVTTFDFVVQLKVVVDGVIVHSQLTYGDDASGIARIMVASLTGRPGREFCASPASVGGHNTQSLMVFVDDVDAHSTRVRAAGAVIATEPKTEDYGPDYWVDRAYEVIDLEGHHWWFCQRIRGKVA